jgi:hypothetical protein
MDRYLSPELVGQWVDDGGAVYAGTMIRTRLIADVGVARHVADEIVADLLTEARRIASNAG